MILTDGQILDSTRFNALVMDQYTNYQESLPLRFLNRTAEVNADDDEITAYFTGRVFAAAVIADDQAAPVYSAGKLELVTNVIPNIKVGARFSQNMISRLERIRRNLGSAGMRGDVSMFRNWEVTKVRDLIRGVQERKNALIAGMLIDNVTYDSLGVKISGSFGMPSDLKFTPAVTWTGNPTTATPITDILTAKQYAMSTYGEAYNRLTMSLTDFNNMVATTEFKQLIQGLIGYAAATTAFNTRSPRMREFAAQILDMEVETEDRLITTQAASGSVTTTTRVFPTGTVLFSNTADDNSGMAYDFGNAVVTESIVASLVGDPDNAAGGPQFGPFGYYTAGEDLNPPNLTAWAVARGFPRKLRKTCTAILTGV